MKRKRNLIILAAIFVALIGVITAEKLVTRHVDKINTTDEIILSIDSNELKSVSWVCEDGELSFENRDGCWYSSEDENFPVNQEKFEEFLSNFSEVHAGFIIDDIENYSQYGIDEPECTVTFTDDSGEKLLKLGGYSTMDSKRYVSVEDGRVYLIDDDLMDYISLERDDFMQQFEIPDFDEVTELIVSGKNSAQAVYDEEGVYSHTDEYNWYEISTGEYRYLRDSKVESAISTLNGLNLSDYVSYTASSEQLSDYGLDNPDHIITVKGSLENENGEEESAEYTVYIGTVTVPAEDEDEEDTVNAYVRYEGSEIIYNLGSSSYETLSELSYNSLRPSEILSLDWESITEIEISMDGESLDVKHEVPAKEEETEEEEDAEEEEAEEDELQYMVDGKVIDFNDALAALQFLTVESFNDEKATKTVEISLVIHLDNEDYPQLTLSFYRLDGEYCIAEFNGEILGYTERAQVADLKEAVTCIILSLES